ncbi:transporter substrate-binding domain-containing protein [Rhizobium sp. YJ-22]|uniref:transporter substrate-binding domain-containing protein n=1 Tax=Rhizobium sp. YJ-22 TaxID=3037556 RepID=UPI001AC3E764|nr:transporter substrate-binding domain-containing protein [Rhizobium sp. YJ-22]MBN9030332.1 transporter substrate-binding domain-containing protein [Hyphomicrobiales bacterium]MDG3579237.1 transporter substrate-binding domain-containing protein [Rhizobium sp. YJ-22]
MKMKIALAASSILLGAILAMAPAQAEEKLKLRIATEGAYPPFNAVDTAGQLVGFDVDIAKALCEEMKADCELVAQDWDGIIPGLLAKKYDVIIASMFITEERKQKVAFTKPYYKAAMTYVMKKGGDASVLDKPDLGGKSVGVQAGTTQATFAEAMHPQADLKQYPSQDEVNLDLAGGRLDMQIGDLVPMLEWTQKTKDGECCELVGKPITDPKFVGEGVGMAVRQEDNALREKLNAALDAIVANNVYKTINDKYFSLDIFHLE